MLTNRVGTEVQRSSHQLPTLEKRDEAASTAGARLPGSDAGQQVRGGRLSSLS